MILLDPVAVSPTFVSHYLSTFLEMTVSDSANPKRRVWSPSFEASTPHAWLSGIPEAQACCSGPRQPASDPYKQAEGCQRGLSSPLYGRLT